MSDKSVVLVEDLPVEMESYFAEIFEDSRTETYFAGNVVLAELQEGLEEEQQIYKYLIENYPSLKNNDFFFVLMRKE